MHTKILLRPLNFHLRYQHWNSKQKNKDLILLHQSYSSHVLGQSKNAVLFEADQTNAKLQWRCLFNDNEHVSYIIEHFKNILLKNKYSLFKTEEKTEVWDNGIKVNTKSIVLKSDTYYNEHGEQFEKNYGDIYLEQTEESGVQILSISAKYYEGRAHFSFEKLMEHLIKP